MEFYGFELRQLQYFVTVAEQSSFSRAAELLFVTQPLISQQISALEQQLGVELFIRKHHNLQLSAAGTAFYPDAKAILSQSNSLIQTVQNAEGTAKLEKLKIGFEELINWSPAMDELIRFQEDTPNFTSEIVYSDYHTIIHSLYNEKLDVVFGLLPNKNLSSRFRVKIIAHTRLCLAASKCQTERMTLAEYIQGLNQKPLYLLNGDYRGANCAVSVCVQLNISPQFHFMDSMHTILLNVAAGNGYAMFPQSVLQAHSGGMLRIESLSEIDETELCIAAIWNQTNTNPTLSAFVEHLKNDSSECSQCKKICAANRLFY